MLAGLFIGIGMVLPGVSGGVLAVILGVYEKIINSISNFKKNPRENIKFLLPLIIGVIIGAIISAKTLKYIFEMYFLESCYLFIGLILGSIPFLIKEVNKKEKKGINYIILSITFVISLIITILSQDAVDFSSTLNGSFISNLKLFFTGFIFISGKIIPGISSSFMLMMIGMYQYFLDIVSNPLIIFSTKIYEIIPILIGAVTGAILLVKLMAILLKKYYVITYSIIIGFVLGSIITLYPGKITILGVLIAIIGFVLSMGLSSIGKNKKV